DVTAASDSGVSSTDNLTNVRTPTFTGTAEVGSTVSVYNGATKVGTGLADANGIWTITTSSMANGVHVMTAKSMDVAGNVSAASGALALTIDTTAPGAPAFTGGNATTLRGTGEAGDVVTILNGTTTVGTATVGSGGNWSWSFIGGLTPFTFAAFQTDKAGNIG